MVERKLALRGERYQRRIMEKLRYFLRIQKDLLGICHRWLLLNREQSLHLPFRTASCGPQLVIDTSLKPNVSLGGESCPFLTAQVLLKETGDPSPRIFRRLFVVPNLNHLQRVEPPSAGIVEKRVPRFRILFHVVRDICRHERMLKLLRHAAGPAVLGSIARDDRTCLRKKSLGIRRQLPAIIHARGSESMIRREQ